jgi:hypothetical protein
MLDERVVAYDALDGALLRRSRERHSRGVARGYDLVAPQPGLRTTVRGVNDAVAIDEANRLPAWRRDLRRTA